MEGNALTSSLMAADDASLSPDLCDGIRRQLGAWYDDLKRDLPWRRTGDPYAVWVSEVMLQQTQVKTVIPYYHRFMTLFPDVRHLARADDMMILKVWEGLGYYTRARNMHRAAQQIVKVSGGEMPREWRDLRQLPGVGDYIAAAVLSIAHGQPYAVVDGNVKRVLARLYLMAVPVNQASGHKAYQAMADQLLDHSDPGRHNQAMMELGAVICAPKTPSCGQCPVHSFCEARRNGQTHCYPTRTRRAGVPHKQLVAGVVLKNGRLLLTQRPGEGLLAGLWEFPGGLLEADEDSAAACARWIEETTGLKVRVERHVVAVRHAYTHFKIHMELFVCVWQQGRVRLNGPAAFRWVSIAQLEAYPLHKAVHKALPALRHYLSRFKDQ